MKRIISILITILTIITFKGCNESRVLEENTKETGLSKYNISYKYLNSDYFEEGYKFNPLYFKGDELYGVVNVYPLKGSLDEYEDNLLYKIDRNGNFKEYENETVTNYLEDWQIRDTIKDKNVYVRSLHNQDINYYYSDFEKESLKEVQWIKEPIEVIEDRQNSIKSDNKYYHHREVSFGTGNNIIYEFNSKYSYNSEDEEKLKDIENYKIVYYIDMENEKFYISDTLKEEPSLLYYYNEVEENFIKINEDGSYDVLELKEGKINFKDYSIKNNINLNKDLEKTKRTKNSLSLKDYSIIEFIDDDVLNGKIIINNNTNEIKYYKEESFTDEDYINIFTIIPNSNYTISHSDEGAYLGVVNEKLEIELLKEIDFNLELYEQDKGHANMDLFSNENSSKVIITLSGDSFNKSDYIFNNIQYIYLDIEESE